jgi:hypothetical protein
MMGEGILLSWPPSAVLRQAQDRPFDGASTQPLGTFGGHLRMNCPHMYGVEPAGRSGQDARGPSSPHALGWAGEGALCPT